MELNIMKDWFVKILRSPRDGGELTFNEHESYFSDGVNSYPVVGDIPVFLTAGKAEENHRKSDFDYAAHYRVDAEQIDYFRQRTDKLTATHLKMLRTSVMRQVPKTASTILDVGCGSAFVARQFCRRGVKVVSLDIAQTNTEKALQAVPSDNHAAVVADAFHLPFADNTFDCIIAAEIIEHTVDPQQFVVSLLAKLKPGGLLVLSTPYKEHIEYSLCIHCNCKTPHNAHLHSFDKESMRQIARSASAQIRRMRLVGNKLLLRTHIVVPVAALGYRLWLLCDTLLNLVLPKAEHFFIVMVKE